MTSTIRLTMSQALTRFLANQFTEVDGRELPLFAGVWAIFGHGNVAALGEALYQERERLPVLRGHNEQGMAHAAIAFAKASFRRRMMVVTTSIGPGALNLATACAVAHVNRLPLLLLPGDVFASRRPDPVLQQVEDFGDATVSANDCFRPISRFYDRITRPEQIIPALERAMVVLTDPAECGPVTLSLCQDVQAEAYDYPAVFFERRVWHGRRPRPCEAEAARAVALLRGARKPLIVAGGGVLYAGAAEDLAGFAERHEIPVAETQAGKSSMPFGHPLAMGAIGVTGTSAANALAEEADVIIAAGTRLQDFTTGSRSLFRGEGRRILGLNIQPFDASKHHAVPLVADLATGLAALEEGLPDYAAPPAWRERAEALKRDWVATADRAMAPTDDAALPSDAQVIGAVGRALDWNATVVCAAGGLPGELHKLWRPTAPGRYHLEYGFSCMGYEIAGGLGVKLARPEEEVVVMVGDGSYLMLNSELASAVMLGLRFTVVLLDNRGYGCINRLQAGCGGAAFNNLLADARHDTLPEIDFAAHARSLGAEARHVRSLAELEQAVSEARNAPRATVIVIDTDPAIITREGGHWWDVAVPEVSQRPEVAAARARYDAARQGQRFD